jgi:siroheme synthase
MTGLRLLGGTARAGTLYGIGVGPGDVRYLTLRAAALVGAVASNTIGVERVDNEVTVEPPAVMSP